MSTLFKDIYSKEFYNKLSTVLVKTIPGFNKHQFMKLIFNENFETYELKQRMTHTAATLKHFLGKDYKQACQAIKNIVEQLRKDNFKAESLEFMFLPEITFMYGIDHYKESINLIEFLTQFISCEFAVRPFIVKYEQRMLDQMILWSKHKHKSVRRLSSEGSRPRLPWAIALPELKRNPSPLYPILENLKNDSCESVRRSVANNLNDIAKDNPKIVIELAKKWKGQSKETDAIIKHGARTLLKSGNQDILNFYGLKSDTLLITDFKIVTPNVKIGGELKFSFRLNNQSSKETVVRLEYGLYYLKSNGSLAKKVFKISERKLKSLESVEITKNQSFKLITTRKFYTGKHGLSIIVNGTENHLLYFNLIG